MKIIREIKDNEFSFVDEAEAFEKGAIILCNKIRQIVIEDIPHKYQTRLLELLS